MCEPTTLLLAATVASAGVQAYSSIQAGRAQYRADMFNAEIANRNADAVERERLQVSEQAVIERRRLGERARAEAGELKAKYAAMGLGDFGTPADLIGDVGRAYMIDQSGLNANEISGLETLDKQEADYRDQAKLLRSSAKGALRQGYLGAAGSLIDGVAGVSEVWMAPTSSAGTGATGPKKPRTTTQSGVKRTNADGTIRVGG